MAWVPAAIGGAASLVGDLLGQSGQQATNAANMQMMLQNEQWQTEMSNTQMQRRVKDLKAAGLNPLLAVGQPGASVPGTGLAQMQNPNASFQNLGAQAATAAQIANTIADTRQKNASAAQTEQLTEPQVQLAWQQTGLNDMTVEKVGQEIKQLGWQAKATEQQFYNALAQETGIQADSAMKNLSLTTRQKIQDILTQAAQVEYQSAIATGKNLAQFQSSWWGQFLNAIGLGPKGGLGGLAGTAKDIATVIK